MSIKEEEFKKKQKEMSNEEIITIARKQVNELAKTGGKSHRMTVPPEIMDTDMIFSEIIDRFETLIIPYPQVKDNKG